MADERKLNGSPSINKEYYYYYYYYSGDFYKTGEFQASNSNSSEATPPREGLNQ